MNSPYQNDFPRGGAHSQKSDQGGTLSFEIVDSRVRSHLATKLGLPVEQVTRESLLVQLAQESPSVFAAAVNECLGIHVQPETLQKVHSVRGLIELAYQLASIAPPREVEPGASDAALAALIVPPRKEIGSGRLEIGSAVGPYQVQELIGHGGFAYVYRARHSVLGNEVVLKLGKDLAAGVATSRAKHSDDPLSFDCIPADVTPGVPYVIRQSKPEKDNLYAREIDLLIEEEGRVLKMINGRGFVKCHSLLSHEGRPVLVLEHASGVSLREKIRTGEDMTWNSFLSVARTLSGLSSDGVLKAHQDLKPENILIGSDGSTVLLDPGVYLPAHRLFCTTPLYNPQLLVRDERSDVVGLAIMLYEAITGEPPFDRIPWANAGMKPVGFVERSQLEASIEYVPPQQLSSKCPSYFPALFDRCIRDQDFTMKDLISAIEKIVRI